MTLFAKSSIVFIVVNVLRVVSVIALCLALSGEIVVMVSDLQGLQQSQSNATSTSPSTVPSARLFRRTEIRRPHVRREHSASISSAFALASPTSATALRAAAAVPTPSVSLTAPSFPSPTTDSSGYTTTCSYVGNTSVPKQVAGALFSTLDRIFCCIILIFALLSEMPPPSKYTQRVWAYAFPPFGETFGVGVLGVVQVFVGGSMLSHAVTGFPLVAGWFLFVLGFINMLFGLALGARIKSIRSIFSTPDAPSGLRSLTLNAAPMANSAQYYGYDTERAQSSSSAPSASAGSGKKRGIQISAPMVQTPAPPVYPLHARS